MEHTSCRGQLQRNLVGPVGSGKIGYGVFALPNGTWWSIIPYYDSRAPVDRGLQRIVQRLDRGLISTLRKHANDQGWLGAGVTC